MARRHNSVKGKGNQQAVKKAAAGAFGLPMRLLARYDAAQNTGSGRRHWLNADALSARSANSPQVRNVLRNNSRYEVANNCYAKGQVLTLAFDVIGTGPRLQLLSDDPAINRLVEQEFGHWASQVHLAAKLRTMRHARCMDGEAFAIFITNNGLRSLVRMDLRLYEADQISSGIEAIFDPEAVDGIEFDEFGNPSYYHVLERHPGDATAMAGQKYVRIPAWRMIHWFRLDRPGQVRGIPEITPSLALYADLRRYRQATLHAAETAARISAALYTDSPSVDALLPETAEEATTPLPVPDNCILPLPQGWKLEQLDPKQPSATFTEFSDGGAAEAARPLSMPKNVALGDSSGYNYASGRLDHQTYFKSIEVDRAEVEEVILDRILGAWLEEARVIYQLPIILDCPHQWFWGGREHVDPLKVANALEIRLRCNTTTLASEYARQGKDWETELQQRARELELARQLGILSPPAPANSAPSPAEEEAEAGWDKVRDLIEEAMDERVGVGRQEGPR